MDLENFVAKYASAFHFINFLINSRKVGPRCLLHSGALQKQLNGKILVALLFNDFLMLTTPVEPIEQVLAFRTSL